MTQPTSFSAFNVAAATAGTAVLVLRVLGFISPGTEPGGRSACVFFGGAALFTTSYNLARIFGARP